MTKSPKKIKSLPSEKWKELKAKNGFIRKRYAVSNLGRIASYSEKLEDGKLLAASLTQKYPSVTLKITGISRVHYVHRLVAECFLKRPSPKHRFVIHLDHVKENNKLSNLKWVTQAEQINHAKSDPAFTANNRNRIYKLNEERVRSIKKKLKEGKSKYKDLAKEFGITEMQLYRIRTGQNWSNVKI